MLFTQTSRVTVATFPRVPDPLDGVTFGVVELWEREGAVPFACVEASRGAWRETVQVPVTPRPSDSAELAAYRATVTELLRQSAHDAWRERERVRAKYGR